MVFISYPPIDFETGRNWKDDPWTTLELKICLFRGAGGIEDQLGESQKSSKIGGQQATKKILFFLQTTFVKKFEKNSTSAFLLKNFSPFANYFSFWTKLRANLPTSPWPPPLVYLWPVLRFRLDIVYNDILIY